MTDEILKLNANNELIAEDPDTGNVRPVQVADLSASGDVSATNVTADTQMNSSSTRPDVFADTVDANQLSGVTTGGETTLKSGDSVKIATIDDNDTNGTLLTLVDQPNTPFKLYAGFINSGNDRCDWEYTFDDGSTINRVGGTGFDKSKRALSRTRQNGERVSIVMLPPATNLVKVRVSGAIFNNATIGAEAVYADL